MIWDIFNEPENVTTVPLREIQRYVDRVLAAGRRADPQARFTVVSRSRPEIVYWQGRGLDLYSHNLFTQRSLEESLAAPKMLDAPIMVAEMAPELASQKNLDALREAGYVGVGIWGWGPDCSRNRVYLPRQKEAFLTGCSAPDFAAMDLEIDFKGRAAVTDLTELGRQQMGF